MLKSLMFWNHNPAQGKDKIYRLTMMSVGKNQNGEDVYDVFAHYGARTGRQTFFPYQEKVSFDQANRQFEKLRKQKLSPSHGYKIFTDADVEAY